MIVHDKNANLFKLQKSFDKGHLLECLYALNSTNRVYFLYYNLFEITRSACKAEFEKSLLIALTSTRVNNFHVQKHMLERLFYVADREKLMGAGDPMPGPGPFTLYRGVSGRGPARRKRGHSWTSDREKAIWFAERMNLEKPRVFQTQVDDFQVAAYCNQSFRNEQEFICLLPSDHKLKEIWKPERLSILKSI